MDTQTADLAPRLERWLGPESGGSKPQEQHCGSPSGKRATYTGELPKRGPWPPPPPKTPPPPGEDSKNAAYAEGAPSSSNECGCREGSRNPAPGETQEEATQRSGAYGEQGGTPAQGRRRAQAHPCPPDFRGKYIIYYIEGQDVPQPLPNRDTVIFKITADGDQEYESDVLPTHPMDRRGCDRGDVLKRADNISARELAQ